MAALTHTDVGALMKRLNETYQPTDECFATPRRMRILLDELQAYTDEVQWARNKYRALGVAAIAAGPAGIALSELLGGGDVDVAQWRSDMANWQYRLAEYQRVLDGYTEEELDSPAACEELYPLVTAPLLDGIYYTEAPGIVLDAEERERIRVGADHPRYDVATVDHPPGHSHPKPPDAVTPWSLGNQILTYQDFQSEKMERFIDDVIEQAKKVLDPTRWPWWAKGLLIGAGAVAVGLGGLYVYRKIPRKPPAKSLEGAPPSNGKRSNPPQYRVSRTYETWDDESKEIGATDDQGFDYEDELMTLDELEGESRQHGPWEATSPGTWVETAPHEDRDYFEKGLETYHSLHVGREDGKPLSKAEIRRVHSVITGE